MEILLAIAVVAVAAVSVFTAARLRAALHDTSARLDEAADWAQEAEARVQGEIDLNQRAWSAAITELRGKITDIQSQVDRATGAGAQDRAGDSAELVRQLRTELQDEFRGDALSLRETVKQVGLALQHLESRMRETENESADLQRWLDGQQDWAARRLADMTSDVAYLDRHLVAIRRSVRRQLSTERTPAGGSGQGMLAGALSTGQAGAVDALYLLYAAFCDAVPLEIIYQELIGKAGARFHLSWTAPDGAPPEPRLARLLHACSEAGAGPEPGLSELRGLLLGLYCAAPSAAEVGPLVVSRSEHHLIAAVLAAAGEEGQPVDLTAWADGYGQRPATTAASGNP